MEIVLGFFLGFSVGFELFEDFVQFFDRDVGFQDVVYFVVVFFLYGLQEVKVDYFFDISLEFVFLFVFVGGCIILVQVYYFGDIIVVEYQFDFVVF